MSKVADNDVDIKLIKTDADYRATLKAIEGTMMAAAGTPEGETLDLLTTLVETYEGQHYPLDLYPIRSK